MAKQLIESLSGDFDPSGFRDEYRERVLELIERKAAGETITVEAPEPERKEVPDLMAALEASIAASKSPPKKSRASNGSGASKKKKAAAKK
jgi:DNA end-binding protein Ku